MILNIFRKRERNPDETVYENWRTTFGRLRKNRFVPEERDDYSAEIRKGKLELTLKKKNLFAWVNINGYIYRDFVLEASLSFDSENGYSATGFVFRYANEENFYYFLISNRGYFRFDVVFNGNPIRLIEWTENPMINPESNRVRIIAHSSHFSFYVDDEWIGEFEDETIYRGEIGFAAQNFNEQERAIFRLDEISVDSRPISVERYYYRWARYVPPEPDFRIRLARTFLEMSASSVSYLEPAALQLKKALSLGHRSKEDHLLYADVLMRLKLYDTALSETERALEMDSNYPEAKVMKANLLYLMNNFLAARDYIREIISGFSGNAILWGLLGNAEYALGNWQKATEAYERAAELAPEEALFVLNLAKSLEMQGDRDKALGRYVDACKLFFEQENYADLSFAIERAKRLDPHNLDVETIRAKMLFSTGEKEASEEIIDRLISAGTKDSAIFYLKGLLLAEHGNRGEAIEFFRKTVEMEPDYSLYWFRLAENLWLSGKRAKKEIERAIELAPDDPWINNLYGEILTDMGRYERAGEYLKRAIDMLPEEVTIVINYSDLLNRIGKREEALAITGKLIEKIEREDPSEENRRKLSMLYNHMGNIFVSSGNYQEGVKWYERALKEEPENTDYLENCASACLDAEMVSRAEEILLKLTDILERSGGITTSVFNLLGRIAWFKGEYRRAELAFREGMKSESRVAETCRLNLASLMLERQRYDDAKRIISDVLEKNPNSVAGRKLLERMRSLYEREIKCSGCGKSWWVPKIVPPQSPLRIVGEPPGDLPAGKCPSCGAIYCVKCVSDHMRNSRYTCPACGEYLKLLDDALKYLWNEYLTKQDD